MTDERGVAIEVRGLWKSYGGNAVLRGVDLDVEAAETLVILGGSGEGKSVLIRQIIGLERPDRGTITIGGIPAEDYFAKPYEEKPFRMSMVFQSSALLNSMTVSENVSLSLREHRSVRGDELRRIVRESLEQVDMEGAEHKLPSELSGGMKKRVAIARALAIRSQVILYDEPTAELDPLLTEEIGQLIRRIQERRRPTQIVVTHNLPLAREIGDHVAVLKGGQVVDYGASQKFWQGSNPYTRDLVRAARMGSSPLPSGERAG